MLKLFHSRYRKIHAAVYTTLIWKGLTLSSLSITRLERNKSQCPVLFFIFNSKTGDKDVYRSFLACLLHRLFSRQEIEIPGAMQEFMEDCSKVNRLSPELSRLEEVLVTYCQESASTVYILIGSLENVPQKAQDNVFRVIKRLSKAKRCKLLVCMESSFLKTFTTTALGKDLKNWEELEIEANEEDIKLYVMSQLAGGPEFMQANDIKTEILQRLIDK